MHSERLEVLVVYSGDDERFRENALRSPGASAVSFATHTINSSSIATAIITPNEGDVGV